jgi:ABC-type lipoprotein release transport system permease subunit
MNRVSSDPAAKNGTILSAAIPVWQAIRTTPSDTLRYEM